MKLSIIIPVYNGEKFIDECLNSILPEIDENIEMLILDDGSKDSSYDKIRKYEKDNIRVFKHKNHGVSYTRNRGLTEAKGEYVMFVDADDRLEQGWKKTVLSECNIQTDVVYYSDAFDKIKKRIDKIDIIHGIFGISNSVTTANMSSPCSKVYRREFILRENIKFDETLINGEDGIFNLNVIIKASEFQICANSFYRYRIYTGSSSRKYSKSFFDSNLKYFILAEKALCEGDVEAAEKDQCMAYAVGYSIYLYLFLVSTIEDRVLKNNALKRIYEEKMQSYINAYPHCSDCNKVVQLIYWLSKNHCIGMAEKIVEFRNALRRQQKGETKWVKI